MSKNIDTEIETLETKLSELKAEKKRLESLSDDKQLAERLHSLMCHWNHTDGCDWYYGNWDNLRYAQEEYLKKARNIIKSCPDLSIDKIIRVIEAAKG